MQLMRQQLLTLLLIISLPAAAQVVWPRNPQTDSIEFRGIIPWPASDTATAQRRALVQQWYVARLVDIKPKKPISWATTYDSAPLTKISLAGSGYFIYTKKYEYVLACKALLSPTEEGMAYRLSDFVWGWKLRSSSAAYSLEALPRLMNPDRESLKVFRARVEAALAGW
jgi:hypothetical protein